MSLYTGGHTTLLSADACQTAIDAVAWEVYERDEQPSYLSSRNTTFFKQKSLDTIAWIFDEYSGVPNIEDHGEQEEVKTVDVFIGNQKIQRVTIFKNDYPISWEAFKTDKVGLRDRIGQDVGDAARRTQDYKAAIDCYGDAFAGANFTTPDGQALASNSHTTLRGDTVDNLETGALAPDTMDTLVTRLEAQLGQHGEFGGNVVAGVLVPRNLYKRAKEILNSALEADTGENNLNIFDTDYGQLSIKQTPLLNSTFNSASNANTSDHIVSHNHHITRRVLSELQLEMIEPKFTKTDSFVERVRFAEVTYPETYFGFAASNGSV